MAQPLQYDPQISPPYFPQYLPANSHQLAVMNHCLQEYFTGKWTWQKDKKDATWREMKEKSEKRNERSERKEKLTKEPTSTRLSKRSIILMVPTPIDVYNG